MKKSLIAAVVFASAFASSAMAATVGNTPQTLDLTAGSNYFGDQFLANNSGNMFDDHFTFSVTGSTTSNLNAIISSISDSANVGLDITGLSLYSTGSNALVANGTSLSSGAIDSWKVSTSGLAAGDYYLRVTGNLVSNDSASFGGAVALAMAAPVPEPETYGMMLAGLGVLGFMARRRKAAKLA